MQLMTWQTLLTCLFIFLLCYYTAVLALFYRHDLLWLAGRFKAKNGRSFTEERESDEIVNRKNADQLYNTVHELMEDCRTVFRNVSNAPVNKNKLIEQLQSRIQKYPQVRGTAFEVSITNHIDQEAEHRLGIKLTGEELDRIWN